jgi:uncharacterized protein (TIGR03435 family)
MRALPSFGLLLTAAALCYSQPAGKSLAFDAASVKPLAPNQPLGQIIWRGGPGTDSPGRFTMPSVTLAQIVEKAYGVWSDQVTGPSWIADRGAHMYSLTATMPASTTEEQFRAMLQNLLAERFHLRLHHVTETRSGYELVVAEGGPKINEWAPPKAGAAFKPGLDSKGFPKMDPTWGPGTLVLTMAGSGGAVAPIRQTRRATMAMFCRELGSDINMSEGIPYDEAQPRVVDRTGLQGLYEFSIEFAGSLKSAKRMPSPAETGSGAPAASDAALGVPDLFTAVERQLGLKLRKLKAVPVDVLVVDSADKTPTAD